MQVGEIQKALFYGTEEFGGEYSSIATLLPTGKGTSGLTFNRLPKINL
jgi:Xaa-Pro dipeptidase/ectoine hydrolase